MDKYMVRSTDGSVDVAASANAYATALTKWAAENEVPAADIEAAVESARHLDQAWHFGDASQDEWLRSTLRIARYSEMAGDTSREVD